AIPGTHQTGQYSFAVAFIVATPKKIAELRPLCWHCVSNNSRGLMQPIVSRSFLGDSDAKFGFFVASAGVQKSTFPCGFSIGTTVSVEKPARVDEHFFSDRHIGTDEIAHGALCLRQAPIGAADNPVKLFREPPRPCGHPRRQQGPADSKDQRVIVMFE